MLWQEKLNLILSKTNLPKEVTILWQGAFKYLKTEQLIALLEILAKALPGEVRDISFNLKKKITALESNDTNLWQKIIREEKESLL